MALLLRQAGFATSPRLHGTRGVLIPHFSPLPRFWRLPQKQRNIVSVALSLISRSAGVTRCHFPKVGPLEAPGLSSPQNCGATILFARIIRIISQTTPLSSPITTGGSPRDGGCPRLSYRSVCSPSRASKAWLTISSASLFFSRRMCWKLTCLKSSIKFQISRKSG